MGRLRRGSIPMVPDGPTWPEDAELLHIIAQSMWHGSAYIAGNRTGLTLLRDALNKALEAPRITQDAHVMCNDGEGYTVVIRCETEREMSLMPSGYTGTDCDNGPWPHWMLQHA